jgi:hypothetical protein
MEDRNQRKNIELQDRCEQRIPFLTGRPKREDPMGPDDVTNLVIALNTCTSLDELFERT